MATRNVILELPYTAIRAKHAALALSEPARSLAPQAMPDLSTVKLDMNFPIVAIPRMPRRGAESANLLDTSAPFSIDPSPEASTYIVRGTVDEANVDAFEQEIAESEAVLTFYADPVIQSTNLCLNHPAVGLHTDVERLLGTDSMHSHGMDGDGVMVAIVDTGINVAYLNSRGKRPLFDQKRSWSWDYSQVVPGQAPLGQPPLGHGTMCAFDVCIAAPKCTLLDIALLRELVPERCNSLLDAQLSDAVCAYVHLCNVLNAPRRPGERRSLVVNNSWAMYHPEWDWPVGHSANYSDNPRHLFNEIVATLEHAGADILFAAGNCGTQCADRKCRGSTTGIAATTRSIYGANSSPSVLCVAGVDTNKQRVGYSSIGPGRLMNEKPDLSGYTHFSGSNAIMGGVDSGTSAACPVVAGVVAAVRTIRPFVAHDPMTHPSAIRELLTNTARKLGPQEHDYEHGHGVVDGCALVDELFPAPQEPMEVPHSEGPETPLD